MRHRVMAAGAVSRHPAVPVAAQQGRLCALDGDGSTLCSGSADGEKLVGYVWSDVPPHLRCVFCAAVLLGFRDRRPPERDSGDAAERARRAFDQAVAAERRAFAVHTEAALMHEALAVRLDAAAGRARLLPAAAHLGERADVERGRAVDAAARAVVVRQRLSAEGVDVQAE
jgi:hypothetical protein